MWNQLAIAKDLVLGACPISDISDEEVTEINSTVDVKSNVVQLPIIQPPKRQPPVCYLASAIRGYDPENISEREVEQNIRDAEEVYVALNKLGFAVICPQTMNRFMGGIQSGEEWMEKDFALLSKADCCFYYIPSPGTDREHAFASTHNIPILSSLDAARIFIRLWGTN